MIEALPDGDAVQRRIGAISRAAPGYTTNFYAAREQVQRWGAAGRLYGLDTDEAALVLCADHDFFRVYHAACDPASLAGALALLPAGSYATDLIGQGEGLEETCAAYAAGGFAPHAFLRRMGRVQAPGVAGPGEAAAAGPDDAVDVAAFLDRLLDRFTEQIPAVDELREAADAGRLLLVRDAARIAGMLMYDRRGQVAHLQFWHVDPDARGAGVGRRLMNSFLSRCAGARRIVLWVIGDNDRSIAIYRHYGFTTDGLLDRIMILHKDQQR